MLGFAATGRHLLPDGVSWGCMAGGAVLVGLYLRHAKRTAHPLIRLDLLKHDTFRAAVTGEACSGSAPAPSRSCCR